jgi:hypothetical protein
VSFSELCSSFSSKKKKQAFAGVWAAIVWSLWLMQNNVVFNNGIWDGGQVLDLIKIRSWTWNKHSNLLSSSSFLDWCVCPMGCLLH